MCIICLLCLYIINPSLTIIHLFLICSDHNYLILKLTNGGSSQSEHENLTFSCVTPPITLDTLDRSVYYYNLLEHVVYKRTLDINSQDEVCGTIYLFNSIDFIVIF